MVTGRAHDPEKVAALLERILSRATGDAEVLHAARDSALTRFANSQVHQNVAEHDASVRSLKARIEDDRIAIRAGGYTGTEPRASYIANARHLFEIACKRPVTVLPEAGQAMAVQEPRASHAA